MEGLEGVAAERGTLTDRAYLETVISALGNRIFLLHDVHRPAADAVPEPVGAVVPARADDARAGVAADGAVEGKPAVVP